jgi:hypothetical protein
LTATIDSKFVKADKQDESDEILNTLARIDADLAALKARLETR